MGNRYLSRRRVIHGTTAFIVTSLTGCTGNVNPTEESNNDPNDNSGNQDIEADHSINVGPEGDTVFEPASLEINPGETVEFLWESDTHTIIPPQQPEGANWDGERIAQDEGFRHVHTFEVEGYYPYYCVVHGRPDPAPGISPEGMSGEILVGDVDLEAIREEVEEEEIRNPQVSITVAGVDVENDTLRVDHSGGDSLAANEVTIVVQLRGEETHQSKLYEATDDLDEDSTFEVADSINVPIGGDVSEGDDVGIILVFDPTGDSIAEPTYRRW